MSLKMQRFASWQLPRRRFVSSMAFIMTGAATLLWLRQDLRLRERSALRSEVAG